MRSWQDISKIIEQRDEQRKALNESIKLTLERITRIREHRSTKLVSYSDFPAAFDYVDKIYPHAKVKELTVFLADRGLMRRVGYGGAGGLYDRLQKTVIITDGLEDCEKKKNAVQARLEVDEVLVHELIHYSANFNNVHSKSVHVEEELAYGHSVNYLRAKGYTDLDIVNLNMMPYLMGAVDAKKIIRNVLVENGYNLEEVRKMKDREQKKIFDSVEGQYEGRIKSEATELGLKIIKMYTDLKNNPKMEETANVMQYERRGIKMDLGD